MSKLLIILVIFCGGLYGAIWVFNHINAWLGFSVLLVTIIIIYLILKNKPPHDNEKVIFRNNPYAGN